jgi:hypothetical protein
VTDWAAWRKCPVCHARTGDACRSLSGTVTNGRPDMVVTNLPRPHTTRRMRSGRAQRDA